MRKKYYAAIAAILIICFLAGCRAAQPESTIADTQMSTTATEPQIPAEQTETVPSDTASPTHPCDATTPATKETSPETSPSTEPSESFSSYLEKVAWADQSIFDGPGYDYGFAGTVELAGTYTIVEEALDGEGNLWGRLKSGAGWIDLSDIRSEARRQMPISANFADRRLIQSGNFYHCIADTSEYMVQIALRTHETLKDVALFSMQLSDDGFDISQELYSIPELTPDKPFVADVSFPGDFTTYAIRFTDSNGAVCYYSISISGRNGTLVMGEYLP